jgi:hypothetical protein
VSRRARSRFNVPLPEATVYRPALSRIRSVSRSPSSRGMGSPS